VSESIEFHSLSPDPFKGEGLLLAYLDDLLTRLDLSFSDYSSAQERVILQVVNAACFVVRGNFARTERGMLEVAFTRLKDEFNWHGDKAVKLGLCFGLSAISAGCTSEKEYEVAMAEERKEMEPSESHDCLGSPEFWRHCWNRGYEGFMDWWKDRISDPFLETIELLDSADRMSRDK